MTTTQQMPSDATLLSDNQQEHEEVRTAEPLPPRTKRRSYRILGTHDSLFDSQTANNNNNENEEEEEDPMAWADLEEFGGTKKTLDNKKSPNKKKPLRELTHEEVKQQLAELQEIDQKMDEGLREKRSQQAVVDTIAWLKKHSEVEAQESNQKRSKRSSSFVRSILNFFSSKKYERDADNNDSNNDEDGIEEEPEGFLRMNAPWGQHALNCDWTEIGFRLLNRSILEDIEMVRPVVTSGELFSATPQALIALAKWLQHFDDHVTNVITLKDYLLEERTVIAGVGYKVTTLYDLYKEAKAQALEKLHGDRAELGDAILHMFTELETILRDEVLAVQDVIKQTLTEEKEYEAISSLFHHLTDYEDCGIIVAKLLGWMKKNLEEAEVQTFLQLFDHDVQNKIAGEWMRHYASYLHLLDEFSVNFDTSMAFFT